MDFKGIVDRIQQDGAAYRAITRSADDSEPNGPCRTKRMAELPTLKAKGTDRT